MILLGREHTALPVSYPKVGRRFAVMQLNAKDFADLAKLSPQELHDWLTHWQCGFDPVASPAYLTCRAKWFLPVRGG